MKWYKKLSKDNPPQPRKVYRQGILYYTTSYMWVGPESKEAQIFTPGWVEWREMNYAHPINVREIEKVRKVQEAIRNSMKIDWSKLEDIVFTI